MAVRVTPIAREYTDTQALAAAKAGLLVDATSDPLIDGSVSDGTETTSARKDHIHPTSAVSQATQVQIEAETDADVYIPSDLIRHNPGVAKAWCSIQADGTLDSGSYNIASISDEGTGHRIIVFDTDFSTSVYAWAGGLLSNSGDWGRSGIVSRAVGSCHLREANAALSANVDEPSCAIFFGDQ